MTVSKTIGLVLGMALLVLFGLSAQALAQVEVNIGISVPRTWVYLAPDIEMDLLFYRGWCPTDRVPEGSEWI